MIKKIATAAVAALTLGGAIAGAATPAAAQGFHGGYGYHGGGYHGGRGWGAGAAVGAGILGLAVGAAIADHPHYAPGYYAPAYGYGYGYGGPCRPHLRWDPYIGRYVNAGYC
jgi:hypothetical protein